MRSQEQTDFGGQPQVPAPIAALRYVFPCPEGGEWALTIPATLARCVGRYARIPEYARRTYLLDCTPVTTATGVDIDAAQRP